MILKAAHFYTKKTGIMTSREVTNKLITYFNGVVIGSMILVNERLISYNTINDIDIAIKIGDTDGVRAYLIDNGFIETEAPYKRKGYEYFEGSFIFKNLNCKPVHIATVKEEGVRVYTVNELIKKKLDRGESRDLLQVSEAVKTLLGIRITLKQDN